MEVEVKRETVFVSVVIILMIVFGVIGYPISPRAANGRPVLLLPDVRAVEQYRRSAAAWAAGWRALDADLRAVLEGAGDAELLATSRKAQRAFERTMELANSVDATDAPPPLLGLRDQVGAVSSAYVDASVAVLRWVSAPSPENKSAAETALTNAASAMGVLGENEWITK